MKIMFISNLYPPDVLGGYEILCQQVSNAFKDLGHEVVVLTSEGPENGVGGSEAGVFRELELEATFDVPYRRSRWRRARVGVVNERRTRQVIRREAPDLIFLWSSRRLTLGPARAAESSGVPVAWTLNDEYLCGFTPVTGVSSLRGLAGALSDGSWARRETTLALKLENITAISNCLRSRLVEQGLPVKGANVVYQGPPLKLFPRRSRPVDKIEKCLYVGQLHPDKGVHIAIEALHQLADRHPELSLSIVGRGSAAYTRRLEELAEEGPARVSFLGGRAHREVAAVYRQHDVLLFPSIWSEPFGLTHLEALASGLPVISTAHGGQGEVLDDGRSALLVKAADPDSMSRALRRLVESPSLARQLAEDGHRLVRERLNLDHYVRQLEAWLTAVVDDAGVRSAA